MQHNIINDFAISFPSYCRASHKIYVRARNKTSETFQFAMVITDGKWRIRNASRVPNCIKELEAKLNKAIVDVQ